MSSISSSSLTSKLLRRFFVILVYLSSAVSNPPCGLYGAPPCQYLPAPPGQTPSCARPGRTYCEHVDNYPTYLIKHLVHKWGYEAKSIIVDESWEDFESLNLPTHDIPSFYDPALIFGTQHQYGPNNFHGYKYDGPNGAKTSSSSAAATSSSSSSNSGYPEPIFIPKPQNSDAANFLIYASSGQQQAINKNKYTNVVPTREHPNAKVTNYTPGIWLKRYVRDLNNSSRTSPWNDAQDPAPAKNVTISARDVSINLDLLDIVGVNKENHAHRVKRQSAGRSSLCQTSSQFVMPQAALNSKGNWMFVVNDQNTARQLVKAELCASSTCSNLCQLPNGYTSRCEQKFVQKRLIALQGSGQNLYTDSFWFPSCCVCTIASS